MIIYCSPGTGKSTFCKQHNDWIDSDTILFGIIKEDFDITIEDNDTKGDQLLALFRTNRVKIEESYTKLLNWLKHAKNTQINVLLGTRRFMWMADKVYIKESPKPGLTKGEMDSIAKWHLPYRKLNYNEFLTDIIKI